MSNISELANVPQISFIENMTLQETEEQLKAEYARIYREQTGKELVLGEADAKTLLLKAFALIEYQTMQYADAKGQAELLKTSTGEALDALVALLGLTRQASKKATAKERFTLAEARADTVAVPAGTRVKTQGGRYFNTLDYAEIPPGATYVDTIVQAEEAGAESSGILAGEINILVDPIPYIASVSNVDESTGGLDVEDDDSLIAPPSSRKARRNPARLWTYAAPPGVSNLAQSATNLAGASAWMDGGWVTPTGYVSSIPFFHGSHPDALSLRFSRPRR